MKMLLLLSLLLQNFICHAQVDTTCNGNIQISYDKITGETHVRNQPGTELASDGNTILYVLMILLNDKKIYTTIGVSFYLEHYNFCPTDSDEIKILFKDGTRCTYRNWEPNCDAMYTVLFDKPGPPFGDPKAFSSKKIDAIRFMEGHRQHDFQFTDKDAEILQKQFGCLNGYVGKPVGK